MLSRIFSLAVLFSLVLGTSACNTTRGAGEDIEAAGEAVQQGAENASEAIDERF